MTALPLPALVAEGQVLARVLGAVGVITLNRPSALNALSLPMIRDLTTLLLHWRDDPAVVAVLVHGAQREGKAPAFCAGGDIRFFHQAALAGDPLLEDFFTEEYALNHLIHRYPKTYVAWMDGICMGGGMGISQGAALRVVTEHTRMAMPETQIGLFPDVGGGWFLARCAGHLGEYLGLTGHILGPADGIHAGLADCQLPASVWPDLLQALADQPDADARQVKALFDNAAQTPAASPLAAWQADIDRCFAAGRLSDVVSRLSTLKTDWARATLAALEHRSPLMLAVTLKQIRLARHLSLADDLRMERGLVRRCFHWRPGRLSETVEGIRALAVDKDHRPAWQPARIDEVSQAQVDAFFASPWPAHAHPLRDLQ